MTATQATTNPKFIVQHTTPGHWQVVEVARAGKSYDGVDYTSFEAAKAVRDRLNGVAPVAVETPAPSLPKPQDHLRKGERRPVKTGRAARTLIGSAMSLGRRFAVLAAYADRFNTGIVTAGQYLTQVLKVDAEFSAAYDSPFGKAIKKAYKVLHGEDPAKIRLVTEHRRLHRAIGYRIDEPALAVATRTYPRTAALLNGAS